MYISIYSVLFDIQTDGFRYNHHTNIIHHSLVTVSDEEAFLQYFLQILKHKLQNLQKILKKCTINKVLHATGSNTTQSYVTCREILHLSLKMT